VRAVHRLFRHDTRSEEPEESSPEPVTLNESADLVTNLTDLVTDLIESTGLVEPGGLERVRERAGASGSLADALVEEGVASSDAAARVLARHTGHSLVDLSAVGASFEATEALPLRVLERVVAVPYAVHEGRLRIAVADPRDLNAIDELRLASRMPIELAVAPRDDIVAELKRLSRASEMYGERDAVEAEEAALEEDDELAAEDGISDGPLVRLVNSIIFQAAEDGASDVHFAPQEDGLVVRVRIDGVLHELQRVPRRMASGVTTRLKVLAKLDIAERRKPQDGRMSLNAKAAGRLLDVRVATLPTVEGESVVLRLLDKSRRPPTLEELGFSESMRAQLMEVLQRPTGALLSTGPTGSGKSTTLYAALAQISRPEINVVTVEDPVEYRLPGLNQVQINTRAGLTFATALRSILRSDPDVVMVGEIRDGETAKISIEAALTGHFVLSTMHTNDAPSAITRLTEMGVEPFVTASALSAVLAQRLARRLCTHCCEIYTPSAEELQQARVSPHSAAASDGALLYRKRGCPRCAHTGYRGRVGIFQLLRMNEELESLAAKKASREELERAAMSNGMRSLWTDGLEKAMAGLTSLEELARVAA
jgi:type IV pilus assembly protein PilB